MVQIDIKIPEFTYTYDTRSNTRSQEHKRISQQFSEHVKKHLGALYEQLNKSLESLGIYSNEYYRKKYIEQFKHSPEEATPSQREACLQSWKNMASRNGYSPEFPYRLYQDTYGEPYKIPDPSESVGSMDKQAFITAMADFLGTWDRGVPIDNPKQILQQMVNDLHCD